MKNITLNTVILLSALLAATAGAIGLTSTSADYGYSAATIPADRTIVITPSTKSVNVSNGETVEFDIQGKTFRWSFNTFHREAALELSKIAPDGVPVGSVRVYVAANPLYLN